MRVGGCPKISRRCQTVRASLAVGAAPPHGPPRANAGAATPPAHNPTPPPSTSARASLVGWAGALGRVLVLLAPLSGPGALGAVVGGAQWGLACH